MTTFLRLLDADADQKGATLLEAAEAWRSGHAPDGLYQVEPTSFRRVPGTPLAYWVSDAVRALFAELPEFSSGDRTTSGGLNTTDDFRFMRNWWEVTRSATRGKWYPYVKGGRYGLFHKQIHAVVDWAKDGHAVKRWAERNGEHWSRRISGVRHYLEPGLTWPLRGYWLSVQAVPAGTIFSVAGKMAFAPDEELLILLALMNSRPFRVLIRMAAGAVRPQHEAGLIGHTPIPDWTAGQAAKTLAYEARLGWATQRSLAQSAQVAHAFCLPELLRVPGQSLGHRTECWQKELRRIESHLARAQSEIDEIAFDLYGIDGEDRRQMEQGFGSLGASDDEASDGDEEEDEGERADATALTEALWEWTVGAVIGRFDVRLATGGREPPPDPDPFDPLPVCSPGMLQDKAGLPATQAPPGYPLELPPHGILVDDPGHPWDVVSRMEAVLDLVAGEHAHDWIQEAEDILGRDLRDWLRRYGFERHLKRYSRSRRKAPLFWHLAPKSREYGIWLYSPAATRDTLYRILNDYVDPKLKGSERRLLELRQDAGDSPTTQQRRELTSQESLVEELRVFREAVALVAPLWAPHRDDGVVLNCAVLWRLLDHHRAWQKECKQKWVELAKGKYDWAGWAMYLWPERVVGVCAKDRSIAIAHGLEGALWVEGDDGKWTPRDDAKEQLTRLTDERRSAALEAALDDFTRAG